MVEAARGPDQPRFEGWFGGLAHVRLATNKVERRALDAIMSGTPWRSAAEILDAAASRWLANKQVFAIDSRGKKMFLAYVFTDSWKRIPEAKNVLVILADHSALRLAS